MSSETFATAIFLITAIVAAAVLVNAFFPIIFQATSTFSESSNSADERLRTDITIINNYAASPDAKIWIKNIGSSKIGTNMINSSDLFIGAEGDFDLMTLDNSGTLSDGEWSYKIINNTNDYLDPHETLEITVKSSKIPGNSGNYVYFSFTLSNGVSISKTFTTSG
ncbi:flagellar protein FlaG [Methanomicrobium sp. W14]|uniref:flagellin n=1 Tax=Methanomicrobium sp. W14 TaxID=2817839 RepID=UPI001AE9F2B8|nr:flagellin [Methanomicrobium sp. W14]MBP2132977.1 flagellar protein FlaG [Methanomicrobium sp. W14]